METETKKIKKNEEKINRNKKGRKEKKIRKRKEYVKLSAKSI